MATEADTNLLLLGRLDRSTPVKLEYGAPRGETRVQQLQYRLRGLLFAFALVLAHHRGLVRAAAERKLVALVLEHLHLALDVQLIEAKVAAHTFDQNLVGRHLARLHAQLRDARVFDLDVVEELGKRKR